MEGNNVEPFPKVKIFNGIFLKLFSCGIQDYIEIKTIIQKGWKNIRVNFRGT